MVIKFYAQRLHNEEKQTNFTQTRKDFQARRFELLSSSFMDSVGKSFPCADGVKNMIFPGRCEC